MEPTARKPQDMIDTTDSLEAVGACRSMKNFLFWVILIGLLASQSIFWLDHLDRIEKTACASCKAQNNTACMKRSGCSKKSCDKAPPQESTAPSVMMPVPLAATVDVAKEVEQATEDVEQGEPIAVEIDEKILLEKETDRMPAEIPMETRPQEEAKEPFKIPCQIACVIVATCNFIVLMAAILCCLTVLMCLKISLTGRLGGINHITKSFFISLFLVVILVPWQKVLPGVLVGAVWLPGELLCGGWAKAQCSAFWKVLFYARFVGLWIVAVWLLIWSWSRSAKWTRATLRRLGVVR